jgi:hypothetical protein
MTAGQVHGRHLPGARPVVSNIRFASILNGESRGDLKDFGMIG